MELIESEPAQIEHVNQILYNNTSHESYECFDARLLLEQYHDTRDQVTGAVIPLFGTYDPVDVTKTMINPTRGDIVNIRYNSLIVTVSEGTYEDTDKNGNTVHGKYTRYDFEVRNSLWDGNYTVRYYDETGDAHRFGDANDKDGRVMVYTEDKSGYKISFEIRGNHRNQPRICFHMDMSGDGRNIQSNTIYLKNPSEYEHQYDEDVQEKGYVYIDNNKPAPNTTITLTPCNRYGVELEYTEETKGLMLTPQTVTSDANGMFEMTYSATNSMGTYYCILKAEYRSGSKSPVLEASQIVKVNKRQDNTVSLEWGDLNQYRGVMKGSVKQYRIGVILKDKFGILKENTAYYQDTYATITFKKITGKTISQTCSFTKEGDKYYLKPKVSYRGYYEDISQLQVSIHSKEGYPAITRERLVYHTWKTVDTPQQLQKAVEDINGPDWIFLKQYEYHMTGQTDTQNNDVGATGGTITITARDDGSTMTIAGLTGGTGKDLKTGRNGGNCILNGQDNWKQGNVTPTGKPIFKIRNNNAAKDNFFKVQLIGLTFKHGNPAITIGKGCRVLVDNCYFTGNMHKNSTGKVHEEGIGTSIYTPSDDKNIAENDLYKLEVRNSTFYNNRGNEIQTIGETRIHHNLFRTDKAECLIQPQSKVVLVRAGNTVYSYNKSHIKVKNIFSTNRSWAKTLVNIYRKGMFNGKGPAQLKGHDKLKVQKDYHNQAYTYARYYYPHFGINTTIVCSPKKGRERNATGHVTTDNWAYTDGYNLTRISKGNGNTHDPWSSTELATPTYQGIYDVKKQSFKKGYDPRLSDNQSLKSQLD